MALIQNLKFLQLCYLSWQVLTIKSLYLCKVKRYGHQIFKISSSQWIKTIAEIWKNLKFLTWHPLADLPWNDPLVEFGLQIYQNLIWLDKNVFHWRVKTGIRDDFIMCYVLWGPWIIKMVNCFFPLMVSTCHSWELFITH